MNKLIEMYSGNMTHQTEAPEHLTPRQLEVLALLCEGLPNKLIGRRLNIANATVKIHVARILRALNVSSRLQAVIAARRLGLEPKQVAAEPASHAMLAAPQLTMAARIFSNVTSRLSFRLPAYGT